MAQSIAGAIRQGDIATLERILSENSDLANARVVDSHGVARSLLHVVTDWPGHFPNGPAVVATLIAFGADANAAVNHPTHNSAETPLHWAASSGDVSIIDALIDGGANIEAQGAIFTNGTPMSDAVVFAQWQAARRLLERGSQTTLWQASALGLLDRVKNYCEQDPGPSPGEITNAFWNACRGGQDQTAEYLLERGADINWVGYDSKTPLAGAEESENIKLVDWLRDRGAKLAHELG
ncbi:MAG: ankyrin repeat domain-containing protein [Pyrinomonadaceae bacterium]